MRPVAALGFPEIDKLLAHFPEAVCVRIERKFVQRDGYKCWKVTGRSWLQWNDGGARPAIRSANSQGEARTWKVFARFGTRAPARWEKVHPDREHELMPGGPDVWGYSYEALRTDLADPRELEDRLGADIERAFAYSIERYVWVSPPPPGEEKA